MWWDTADWYSCESEGGETRDLPLGAYQVAVAFTDDSGHSLFALSDPIDATLESDADVVPLSFTIPTETGTVSVGRWFGQSCNEIGVLVELEVIPLEGGPATSATFPCSIGSGEIGGVPLGEFQYRSFVRDGDGQIVTPDVGYRTGALLWGNQLYATGNVPGLAL